MSSSNPRVRITNQLEKILNLLSWINGFLVAKKIDTYKSFTGDGMFIVLSTADETLELSFEILDKIKEHNHGKEDLSQIKVKIGIGAGAHKTFNDTITDFPAPWGPGLILARRICDLANVNQILLTNFAKEIIANDIDLNEKHYGNLYAKGKFKVKHIDDPIEVFSYYDREHGSLEEISYKPDITEILLGKLRLDKQETIPLMRFTEERIESGIDHLGDICTASGLDLGKRSTDLLYKVLFHFGERYIAASYKPPGEFWLTHNCGNPYNLLKYHKALLCRQNQGEKNYRFLIMEKATLKKDFERYKDFALNFMDWHNDHNHRVSLYRIDIDTSNEIFNRYESFHANGIRDIGIGLWYGMYILQFGPIKNYVNSEYNSDVLVKRKFWFDTQSSDTYREGEKFFEDLVNCVRSGNADKIDKRYLESL